RGRLGRNCPRGGGRRVGGVRGGRRPPVSGRRPGGGGRRRGGSRGHGGGGGRGHGGGGRIRSCSGGLSSGRALCDRSLPLPLVPGFDLLGNRRGGRRFRSGGGRRNLRSFVLGRSRSLDIGGRRLLGLSRRRRSGGGRCRCALGLGTCILGSAGAQQEAAQHREGQ
ncbi:MAG: hypothetical protein F4Z41_09450, partial [Acidimicrobiia bacterium]|nr:hypothetical protein [Acidimicrobiia bacterium]